MGNRGCLHDVQQQIRRQYQGQRWIICLLEFKGRKRSIMAPGRYTELFFLDEATALAAGHRPCAECQRQRFNLFREIWAKANAEITSARRPAATIIDALLHKERTSPSPQSLSTNIDLLPGGTFVSDAEQRAYLVFRKELCYWSPAGYKYAGQHGIHYPVRLLTPASVVRTFAAGYPVNIHPSAVQVIEEAEARYLL